MKDFHQDILDWSMELGKKKNGKYGKENKK